MREYDVYLPTTKPDGAPIDSAEIDAIKERLVQAFGGYTHLRQRHEGAWRVGGVTFRDEVTILRVLDDGRTEFDMGGFKKELEERLAQDAVLIVAREVKLV